MDAFFSYGFRPFFLGAAVYAALLMALWLVWLATVPPGFSADWLPISGSPYAWHAHEMVFGFAAAAVAGFLLTAVPNWTGALPISGPPLAFLFLVWVAGRLVMLVSGALPAALVASIDVALLPLLGSFAARQLMVRPAPRNLVFLALLGVLTAGNAVYHLATYDVFSLDALAAMRMGLMMIAVMIAIIGGRIIPAFTHNWMHLKGIAEPMPKRVGWLDALSIFSIVLLALLQGTGADDILVGGTAMTAAALNAARLALWRGLATRREPIVWVLHLGYAWIVAGLALTGLAALTQEVPATLAAHAIGTGAAGTMILAVMSRASLGHTGRPLVAPPAVVAAYLLVTLAGLLRVAGPWLAPEMANVWHLAAGLSWIAAFALFAVVYAPILTTPRVRSRARAA